MHSIYSSDRKTLIFLNNKQKLELKIRVLKSTIETLMIRVFLKTAFIQAIFINEKVAKIKTSCLTIGQTINTWLYNSLFNSSFNKSFDLYFGLVNCNFFYYRCSY